MNAPRDAASWFGPPESMLPGWSPATAADHTGFVRLWRGFMAVRLITGIVLLLLQGVIVALGQSIPLWLLMVALAYPLSALLLRLRNRPVLPLRALDLSWVVSVGSDIAYFSLLQMAQTGGLSYTPLFALPVLLAAVLGTVQLALGTAAVASLLLLADAWSISMSLAIESPGRFLQAGLTGIGLFTVAVLANQLARRLAREERRAIESQRAERMQALVNALVIDNISDGVLVVDYRGLVHAVNPAARSLLGADVNRVQPPFSLRRDPAWHALADAALMAFERREPVEADIDVGAAGAGAQRLHVRTRMTAGADAGAQLCVFFLQDVREIEARVRTEKLAAMGRMSAAVAHEIRNPLAAIAQANALLEEDISDPSLLQLTGMVRQNAQRLARIVDDVLDVARAQQQPLPHMPGLRMPLDVQVRAASDEWADQTGHGARLRLQLQAPLAEVVFEPEHLRRLLVNLLDNAARYASEQADAIRIATQDVGGGRSALRVWSDGAPIEQAVQRHLFEPFFSSESRSSGLGLHICRELCEQHGAQIGFERVTLQRDGQPVEGNAFFVVFRASDAFDTIGA